MKSDLCFLVTVKKSQDNQKKNPQKQKNCSLVLFCHFLQKIIKISEAARLRLQRWMTKNILVTENFMQYNIKFRFL